MTLYSGGVVFIFSLDSQAYAALIRVTYGLNVRDDDDLISVLAETLHRLVENGAPGISIVDNFPIRESMMEALQIEN